MIPLMAHNRTSTDTCSVGTPQKDQNPALDSLSQLFPHGEVPHKVIPKLTLGSPPDSIHLRTKTERQTGQDSLRAPPSQRRLCGSHHRTSSGLHGAPGWEREAPPSPCSLQKQPARASGKWGPGFSHQLYPLITGTWGESLLPRN